MVNIFINPGGRPTPLSSHPLFPGPPEGFAGAAIMKCHTLGGFKQWEFIPSQLWRFGVVQSQGAGRTVLSQEAPQESLLRAFL